MGNMIEIDWQYIYKGTIRDFFPPAQFVPFEEQRFQIYTKSLGEQANSESLLSSIGKPVAPTQLSSKIDVAFLALDGPYGEDGFIQGLLDYYEIPYTGSGVYASAVGISKALQKKLMRAAGIKVNNFSTFSRNEFDTDPEACYDKAKELEYPMVAKASSQESSIGVHFLNETDYDSFKACIKKALFRQKINKAEWVELSTEQKEMKVRELFDLQHGLGLPAYISGELVHYHNKAIEKLNETFETFEEVEFESAHGENKIVVEEKLIGKEFSCIVVRGENGKSVALPPTEIRKANEWFDCHSEYLPGITRKITPIEIAPEQIESIRIACVELFEFFEFNVYARIDGFISAKDEVFLNDPNITSGMMPSSFFFHQAA